MTARVSRTSEIDEHGAENAKLTEDERGDWFLVENPFHAKEFIAAKPPAEVRR